MIVCPARQEYNYNTFSKEYSDFKEMQDDGHVLLPHSFILGWTEENVELFPYSRIAARAEGKSSLARLGIGIH